MNRFIDPQKIHYFKLANGEQVATKESIDKIPAADVHEVKQSKWMHGREVSQYYENGTLIGVLYENWKCGNCNYMISDHYYSQILYKYCPYCGAKMDEKEKEKIDDTDSKASV